MGEQFQEKQKEKTKHPLRSVLFEAIIKVGVTLITAIAGIIVAWIYVDRPYMQERAREVEEEQEENERKLQEEELVVWKREWETHAGIEYIKYTLGTQSEAVQFRVRPYFFYKVTFASGKEVDCWIVNHYTQEEYLSENHQTELLEEYNIEELNGRVENMLQAAKLDKAVTEIDSYTLLLVEYDVREVSPQYACYFFKDGILENRGTEWGSGLIRYKDNHLYNTDRKVWEWVECP